MFARATTVEHSDVNLPLRRHFFPLGGISGSAALFDIKLFERGADHQRLVRFAVAATLQLPHEHPSRSMSSL